MFDKSRCTWMLTEPVEETSTPVDPEALHLSAFLRSLGSFEGTATELSVFLERQNGEHLTPSVLAKRLVKHARYLEQVGIRVVSQRTRTARLLSILCLPCDGSDGSDGKNDTVSVANLPSHLSQPSRRDESSGFLPRSPLWAAVWAGRSAGG